MIPVTHFVRFTLIYAHFRKEEAKRIRDEMRELFLLFGSPGQWERLQGEIANERSRRKKALEELAAKKRRLKNTIIIRYIYFWKRIRESDL